VNRRDTHQEFASPSMSQRALSLPWLCLGSVVVPPCSVGTAFPLQLARASSALCLWLRVARAALPCRGGGAHAHCGAERRSDGEASASHDRSLSHSHPDSVAASGLSMLSRSAPCPGPADAGRCDREMGSVLTPM
jgi:hypothetical protein